MKYYTEPISSNNFDEFLKVFKIGFNTNKYGQEYFYDKYDTAYTGSSFLGFLAFDKKTKIVVAYYGVIPTIIKENGKEFLAAQAVDAATHPEHRRKGLLKLVHDKTLQLCKNKGVKFIFGFPNSTSYQGFKKFGWSDKVTSYNLTKQILPGRILNSFRRRFTKLFSIYQKAYVSIYTIAAEKITNLELDTCFIKEDKSKIYVPRNLKYLAYKIKLGSKLLKLRNGIAWVSIEGNQLKIGEIFAANHSKCLCELENFAKKIGLESLFFATNEQHLIDQLTNDLSFKHSSSIPLIIYCLNKEIEDSNFVFTSADYDTF